jgi:hypothetical protein
VLEKAGVHERYRGGRSCCSLKYSFFRYSRLVFPSSDISTDRSRLRPSSTFSLFDRSPISFRCGSGYFLMRYGATVICFVTVSSGCFFYVKNVDVALALQVIATYVTQVFNRNGGPPVIPGDVKLELPHIRYL